MDKSIEVDINQIPKSFIMLLNQLRQEEGGVLHFNKKEKDITTGYGIYKYINHDAEIFSYIESIAKDLRINTNTRTWRNRSILERVNEAINPDTELWLSYLFYKKYYEPIHLDKMDSVLSGPIASLYANGMKLCVTSIQRMINTIYTKHSIDPSFRPIGIDGVMGPVTTKWYLNLNNLPKEVLLEAKFNMLIYAKSYYINLAVSNPNRYLVYLKGWDSRVNKQI